MNQQERSRLSERLDQGQAALGLQLSAAQQSILLDYLAMLEKWNLVYNLTAVRDPQQMLTLHLLDSLAIVPLVRRLGLRHVLDVGSGGGLPGIPLAVAMPELRVEMVDTVQKKVAFQSQVKAELKLPNIHSHHARVEALTLAERPDGIVSRAFSELASLVTLAGHLLAPGGRILAMKGQLPERESAALPAGWRISETVDLRVPELDAQRCVLVLERASS